jgi:beta-galactosidase/beta-glucuronidase
MQQYYGFDSRSLSLEDFCYVSQLLQAWGTGYGIFQHIKQQPHCMGTLYWQLNDCWPVASWSSIDYYGNWKALHYRAQALYADNVDLKKWEQYYSAYPKSRKYPEPKYNISQAWQSDGRLVVTLKAESDLYDLYLDTDPHIDGHFTRNFVDLKAGQKLTTTFVPVDPKADVSNVNVTIRTLNDIYLKHR